MAKKSGLTAALKAAIKADDRTLYKIAQEAGINLSMLLRFVEGDRDLQLSTAEKVCEVLGLELVKRS